ncbi:UbiX family flavin prenyltransferase [Actinosynnema sp. NPDC050436]|uniref:UbiX family flavin prenyltransferase n=1 Tax=Actinosynnema sp. NPDC050436 TaxID=3155659 RepID=UPI0033EC2493
MKRVIVGISGASGVVYGIRALELLARCGVETHLVLTRHARATIAHETDLTVAQVKARASVVHGENDLGAAISSGSFPVSGMLVAPCSIKSLSGVANSFDDTLLVRAADVQLKERRPLVLLVRETPLHAGHLRLMCEATAAGAIVMPPVPAFYHRPSSVEDLVDHTVTRALDLLGFVRTDAPRWTGDRSATPIAAHPVSLG